MNRPTLEVADIVRRAGNSFWQQQQSHFAWPHRKVLDAIVRCRTAALGGHLNTVWDVPAGTEETVFSKPIAMRVPAAETSLGAGRQVDR
jgi:hypothetical protein